MAEREPSGYLRKAIIALEGTGDPTGALGELERSSELSDQLNSVLSCFNISPKTATFLRIGAFSEISEVRQWFQETYVKKDDPRFLRTQVANYCNTLIQFGMIEKSAGNGEDLILTKRGEEVGQATAAKILTYEQREKKSLFPVFGQVAVAEGDAPRAPLTRAKILLALKQRQQDSSVDLLAIQERRTIAQSLINLQRAGVVEITYERVTPGPAREYKILDLRDREKVGKTKVKRKKLAEMVAAACESISIEGNNITAASVLSRIPKDYRDSHAEVSLKTNIYHLLQAFTSDINFLVDTTKHQSDEIIESAKLTPEGEKLVTELLLPLVDALKGDSSIIAEWKQLVPQVRDNLTQVAQEVFEYYAPHGPGNRERDREQVKESIIKYVADYPPSVTNEGEYDLRTHDIRLFASLPFGTTEKYLRELVAEGKLVRIRRRGYYVYTLPEVSELEHQW